MVGALIGKGLCNLSIHGVDWTYRWSQLNGSETSQAGRLLLCIQDGVCRRCGAKCSRICHAFHRTEDLCTRCGELRPQRQGD